MAQSNEEIVRRVSKLRRICLVHRYLYYVKAAPLIDDCEYDRFERELVTLLAQNEWAARLGYSPADCPTLRPGSSLLENYPKETQCLGESLLLYNPSNIEWWAKVTDPEFDKSLEVEDDEYSEKLF